MPVQAYRGRIDGNCSFFFTEFLPSFFYWKHIFVWEQGSSRPTAPSSGRWSRRAAFWNASRTPNRWRPAESASRRSTTKRSSPRSMFQFFHPFPTGSESILGFLSFSFPFRVPGLRAAPHRHDHRRRHRPGRLLDRTGMGRSRRGYRVECYEYIYIFFNRVFEANGSSFYRWLFFSIRSRADAAAGSPRHCLGCPTRFLLVPDSVQLVLIGFATSVDLVELSCHLVSLVDLCHRLGGLYLVLPSFEHCLWEFFDFYWYWPRVT